MHNWTIPKVEKNSIYEIGKFDFTQNYVIKTFEQTIPIKSQNAHINLFSKDTIKSHRKKFKYLHVGLVQIAVKPLFRLGLDVPILLTLRDKRHLNFENLILSLLESNLESGPVFSNCYPKFSIKLTDGAILNSLNLHIQTKNLEFNSRSNAFVVIYRVYYKLTNTQLNIEALHSSPRDESLLVEVNLFHSNVKIPKRIPWNLESRGLK